MLNGNTGKMRFILILLLALMPLVFGAHQETSSVAATKTAKARHLPKLGKCLKLLQPKLTRLFAKTKSGANSAS